MKHSPKSRAVVISAAVAALALTVGCAGGGKKHDLESAKPNASAAIAPTIPTPTTTPPAPATTVPPVAEPAVTPTPAPAPAPRLTPEQLALGPNIEHSGPSGSGCSPGDVSKLPDGWWAGHITAVEGKTVEFDIVCMFHDEAAWSAAREDGHEDYGEDMYVRNNNPRAFSVTLVSLNSQATLAGSMSDDNPEPHVLGSLGDVLEIYRLSQQGIWTMMTNQGEVQAQDTMWLHTSGGVGDYVFMQPSC
jgi:hypothetical protein